MENNYSLVITGEWPGAGQSTTASMLAKELNFERVYAGFLFRKFAHVWQQEKQKYSWEQFETLFAENKIDLNDYQFTEKDFNEKILHQWQKQLKKVKTPDSWDKIIDTQSLLALRKPGVVVEAKVGVLLEDTGLASLDNIDHKIYKILLTCPPEISAHRIIKRKIENGELDHMDKESPAYLDLVRNTASETIKRHLRDWERYEKIYGIKRSNIYKKDIWKISTSDINESQVVNQIIQKISSQS